MSSNDRKGKKNFRKMPEQILGRIERISQNDVVIACVKKISAADIAAGKYAHLGIDLREGYPVFPSRQVPKPTVGKYSRINARGTMLIRMDLPKTTKTYSIEAPNFGDWSRGSHTVEWDREVYRRDFFPPKELEIETELLGEEIKGEQLFIFKFVVIEVLDKKSITFKSSVRLENALFFNLNLLQENIGAADIFASTATREDYLGSLFVDWEILPPGDREGTVTRILSGFRSPSDEIRRKLIARYNLLAELRPLGFIRGVSGLRRYFGAQFTNDLIVFENIEYGNAIYAMDANWETLSKSSRLELLRGDKNGFERIVHRAGWEDKLKDLVASSRLKPAA
jgi:hypothetical protein